MQIEMMKMFRFLNPLMPGGNKESYILKTKLQVCFSTFDLLLPAGVKGLTQFVLKFMSLLSSILE